MGEIGEKYTPELEWEYSDFPVKIINLEFETTNWGFGKSATITIYKDRNRELKGEIEGFVSDFKKNQEESYVGKGNIITGQIINGIDDKGNIIKINECFFINFQSNSYQKSSEGYYTKGTIIFDSLNIKFSTQQPNIRYDWFICHDIPAHFNETTTRQIKLSPPKVRIGIDDYNDSIENLIGSSSSRDYCQINLSDLTFIISEVPTEFLNEKTEGLCFEFRENIYSLDQDFISGIKWFVSFLLGNELHYIGNSFIHGEKLVECNILSHNKSIQESTMPPIKFNFKYEWGNFSFLVNQYLPKYLDLKESLSLDAALSKYWISRSLPIGTNLPVLASIIETIAGKYLNKNNINQFEYLSKDNYLRLIENEIESIGKKLKSMEGGQIILNKILGAFRKGPNEKMNVFFNEIGLSIGKLERKALNLRNKMAHSSKDYSCEKDAFNDLILSRAYEILFNRVLLKLIGYEGYYIDYSVKGCPLKHIDKTVGE